MTFRLLPPDEWFKLVRDGIEPFATYGLERVDPQHWRMVVAEEDGRIIALSSLTEAVHNDWFISRPAQRNPNVAWGLWRETKRVLDEAGVELVHATIKSPPVQAIAEGIGFVPTDAKLYVLYTPDCTLNRR